MSQFAAILDACVLVPVTLSDTLLRIAERGIYRPLWSQRILTETRSAITAVHPDIDVHRVDARLHAMNENFEDACVEGWQSLVDGLFLPDPEDRHVLAAAIRGRADVIVTANLADFPSAVLATYEITAISPDEFLLDQLDLAPRTVLATLREQAAATKRPPQALTDMREALRRGGAPEHADATYELLTREPFTE